MADLTVAALRDVMRLSSPPALEYEAFAVETGDQVSFPELEAFGLSRRGKRSV